MKNTLKKSGVMFYHYIRNITSFASLRA
jgi:hypothetical protein